MEKRLTLAEIETHVDVLLACFQKVSLMFGKAELAGTEYVETRAVLDEAVDIVTTVFGLVPMKRETGSAIARESIMFYVDECVAMLSNLKVAVARARETGELPANVSPRSYFVSVAVSANMLRSSSTFSDPARDETAAIRVAQVKAGEHEQRNQAGALPS